MKNSPVWFVSIIAGIATLALLHTTTPAAIEIVGPRPLQARQGEWAQSSSFGLRVTSVALADKIRIRKQQGERDRDTAGVWVVVHSEAQSLQYPLMLRGLALLTLSGRSYHASTRLADRPDQLADKLLQPGLMQSGISVFEIPKDEVQGVRFLASISTLPIMEEQVSVSLEAGATTIAPLMDLSVDGK